MQTAAAYIRVSTEDQLEFSPDSQLKKIQEYALSHGISLPAGNVYTDEGISGRSAAKRPAFQRMIGDAKRSPRPFDVILVWKFSRFARSRQDSILYKSMLRRECGVSVVSVTEQLSDEPASILVEALLEAMDEYYSINLAQEVRRGMQEKFSRGGVVSTPPFGYRIGQNVFEPDEKTARYVPMIYQDFLAGYSCRRIAGKLNDLGVRTRRGNPFEIRTVEYILTNPVYIGKLRRRIHPGDDDSPMLLTDAAHTPLVAPEIFAATEKRMAALKGAHPRYARSAPASYLLQGLVRCSFCGAVLSRTDGGQSLQCSRYARGQCPQSHFIRLEKLRRTVLRKLADDLSGFCPDLVPFLSSPDHSEAEKNRILRSIVRMIRFDRTDCSIRIFYYLL